MSDPTATMTPEQQAAYEEAKKKFDELKTQFDRAMGEAKDAVQHQLKVARERLAFAERELERSSQLRERLEANKADPQVVEHYEKMRLLSNTYAEMKAMQAAEVAVLERNFKEIDQIPPLELRADYPQDLNPVVVPPQNDLGYLEHRTRMDLAMLEYHWYRNRRGLDVVMRAAGCELQAYEAGEEEATQAAAAEQLKQAMAADKETQILVGKLGPELEEGFALLDWGRESLSTLGQLAPAAKREALADPDWTKVNARVTQILELAERVHQVPALAPLFPYKGKPQPLFELQP